MTRSCILYDEELYSVIRLVDEELYATARHTSDEELFTYYCSTSLVTTTQF